VVGTSRIATMHLRLAVRFANALPIRLVKPEFSIPRLVEMIQWHKYRDLDPASMWLRERIIEVAQSMPTLESLG
jgi:hypothetical protein